MNSHLRAAVAGTGSYVPTRVLGNAELEQLVETSNEWIVERTGIYERRIAAADETTSSLASRAATAACADAKIDAAELDLIIVSTATPDHTFPSTACLVQHEIGATRAGCFDLSAACSGFIYGVNMAAAAISAGLHRNVLVIGAETLSRIVDYQDRGTCILFGDGAGAVVLRPSTDDSGMLYSKLGADGSQADVMRLEAGGSKFPASHMTVLARQHYIQIEGRRVFRFATNTFVEIIQQALKACDMTLDDVAMVIPHQVNERIIDLAMKKVGLPREKCFVNINKYGNTSAASVPIALDEARRQGQVKRGDVVVLLAFGSGLTWGSLVVRL